ncbi:MAG: hypothetical protein C0417_02535 [Chlorobiaceae bacterium]|nr:hypothetical protein [Chlorobiaceae bacterium]
MRLIINKNTDYHVSLDAVAEFENAILSDTQIRAIYIKNKIISKICTYCWLGLKSLSRGTNHFIKPKLFIGIKNKGARDYFAVLMGLDVNKVLPYFLFSGRKNIYLFDAWPNTHERLKDIVKYWNINHVFLSSSQAVEQLCSASHKCNYSWIPEGINPDLYMSYSYNDKNIDVVQVGRKYETHHRLIVEPLEKERKVYLYEKVKGEIIFPGRGKFIEGIARAKISICVPSSITHPVRAGGIETMTIRYLQSMVSKCLLLGHAPQEMIRLFGYNPVIEIDSQDPVKQIFFLLEHIKDYIPLIEKNYKTVVEHHTWRHRWESISNVLRQDLRAN